MPSQTPKPQQATSPADTVPFALVDVFGAGPLTGNPLAVVDLTANGNHEPPMEWLRAVAREFNQAETTFVLPPTRSQAHRRLRSFTAGGVEVFGAGHNALGAWWWLLHTGKVQPPRDGVLVQEIGSRLLQVQVNDQRLAMHQDRAEFGEPVAASDVAAVVGLDPTAFDPTVTPRVVDTGASHLIACLGSTEALHSAQPTKNELSALTTAVGAQGLYLAVIGDQRPRHRRLDTILKPQHGLG
jgi:trans-2,3-dihydro-3-hydroxyanthranilate isomerase